LLPYGDDPHPKATRFPVFTVLFLLINIVVFIYQVSLGTDGVQEFVLEWGFIPEDFWSGDRVYTIMTSMFLHGGLLHIISNMIFLAIFGPNVEDQLGRRTFLGFISSEDSLRRWSTQSRSLTWMCRSSVPVGLWPRC
jgi:membrane associated rhomboid family serine protease